MVSLNANFGFCFLFIWLVGWFYGMSNLSRLYDVEISLFFFLQVIIVLA